MSAGVVVLDLDGVIVKTNSVKHDAMLSLFSDRPKQQAAISKFILSNGGVPRKTKLVHILQHHLNIEPTDALLSNYLERYAIVLAEQLATAPLIEGVEEFITQCRTACYVCSSVSNRGQTTVSLSIVLSLIHKHACKPGGIRLSNI